MKLLLLADIPPCSNYTGGVVLAEQIRMMGEHDLAAFIVLNPDLTPGYYPDLDHIPMKIVEKPREAGLWDLGLDAAIERERINATVRCSELVEAAVAFGREHRIEGVWSILEGQTIVRMALRVATELGVPLYSQVWDPLSWWLKAHKVDPVNSVEALTRFDEALSGSRACATASWAMAEHYAVAYGTPCVPVISSLDPSVGQRPAPSLRDPNEVVIGMVGQFYAQDAWTALVDGLNDARWRIGTREVRVYYLGHEPPRTLPEDRLIYGGWMSQPDAIAALSRHADICYCPYPFDADFQEVARLSFPSKAVMYLAAGRPVICHAPLYASPAIYFNRNQAALVCGDVHASSIYEMLRWVVSHPEVYEKLCMASQQAFHDDFTTGTLRSSLRRFFSEPAQKAAK